MHSTITRRSGRARRLGCLLGAAAVTALLAALGLDTPALAIAPATQASRGTPEAVDPTVAHGTTVTVRTRRARRPWARRRKGRRGVAGGDEVRQRG
jgi:hypothetical protein